MSLDDLREHGVLLPEEEWGSHALETTVPELRLLAAFTAGLAGLGVAWAGDGGPATGIGMGVFLAALYAICWICDRAVARQRRRVRRERAALPPAEAESQGRDGG